MGLKSLALAVGALAVGATIGLAGLNTISAATSSDGSSLIENLAEKFNVSTDEVKGVFEQTRQGRQAEMKKQTEEKLTQAAKDGKITDAQKNTILSKIENIQKQQEEAMNAREDLRNWASDNNVDLGSILPVKGFGMHRGFGGF